MEANYLLKKTDIYLKNGKEDIQFKFSSQKRY